MKLFLYGIKTPFPWTRWSQFSFVFPASKKNMCLDRIWVKFFHEIPFSTTINAINPTQWHEYLTIPPHGVAESDTIEHTCTLTHLPVYFLISNWKKKKVKKFKPLFPNTEFWLKGKKKHYGFTCFFKFLNIVIIHLLNHFCSTYALWQWFSDFSTHQNLLRALKNTCFWAHLQSFWLIRPETGPKNLHF